MNNLFILHTQYNIILGSAIAISKCKDDCNDLIIYAEFTVSDEYRNNIAKVFDNVYYLRDQFQPLPNGFINEEIALWKDYRKFKDSIIAKNRYDHVFLSQERPLDSMMYGYFKQKNEHCICSDIEEDCYYSLRKEFNNPNYQLPQGRGIVHALRKIFYGEKYLYRTDGFFYGFSPIYSDYYVIYPKCLRPQLQQRNAKTIGINKDEIAKAVNAIYGSERTDVPLADKYYLFFFDLLERYKDPQGIDLIIKILLAKANEEGAILLLKYHPRETKKYELNGAAYEIASIVPAEKILCDLDGKNVTVFGNATTSIIVANKFGFKTYSVAKLNGSENNTMFNTFKQMGILVPSKIDEI